MLLLLILPLCLVAIVVFTATAVIKMPKRGRRLEADARPIFVPSAMHACDSVRVVWY